MKTSKWFLTAMAALVLALALPAEQAGAQDSGKSTIYNKTGSANAGRTAARPAKPLSAAQGKHAISGNPDDMSFSDYMQYQKNKLEKRVAQDSQKRSVETKTKVDGILTDTYKEIERQRLAYSGYSGSRQTVSGRRRTGETRQSITPYVYPTPSGTGQNSGPFSVFKFNKKK